MKRFFFLSIFFHGALLLILFSWEIPQADKLFPRRVIEVSLIQAPPVSIEKKEPIKPLREREIKVPPRSKEEKKKKEKPAPRKEEEKEKEAPTSLKEEVKKTEPARNEDVFQIKRVAAPNESPVLVEEEHPPSPQQKEEDKTLETSSNHEREEDKTLEAASNIPVNFQGGGLSPSNYLISTASRLEIREHKKPDPQGNVLGKEAEESGAPVAKAHTSSSEVDQVHQQIILKIEAAKHYPRAARRMGIEGTAVVRFKIKPQGQVEAVEIAESSGSEILDHASLQTVRDAAPLPYKEGWLKVGIVFKIL